jgi:RecB family exonuclease
LDTTEFLLKGFLDLVRFDPDTGNPTLILDYKTGSAPAPGSPEDLKHAKQLRIYRAALAATYSCEPSSITLQNYYAATNQLLKHS